MDVDAPAFVLELEIDDEISFKPIHKHNKRALQTLDSNALPIATPEKKKQIQKIQNTTSTTTKSVPNFTPDVENSTPLMMMNALSGTDQPTPLPVYTDLLENTHMPKYSQAELDALKIEWQAMSDVKLNEISQTIHEEVEGKVCQLVAKGDSLQLEKSILERQVTDLQATLFENRIDESNVLDEQVKILNHQLQDAKVQKDSLLLQHEQTIANLKIINDKRISEMIKSHATSILAMQERVMGDITAAWQQKLAEEQSVTAELREQIQTQSAHLILLEEESIQAVKDAKEKIRCKAQLQLDAVHLKFNEMKQIGKESQENIQTQAMTIVELKDQLYALQSQLEQSRKEAAESSVTLRSLESGLAKLITSFSTEPLEGVDLTQDAVRLEVFERIQHELSSKAIQLKEAGILSTELTSEIVRLKESMLLTNTNLSAINAEKEELSSSLSTCKAALEVSTEQLSSSRQEKDSQMLVIANMITEKGKIDSELEKSNLQNQELTHRCEDLRSMNDEVMSMLEKIHEK